jgi:hypothetical protein
MQSANLIITKKINVLHCFRLTLFGLFFIIQTTAFSQDNSPYSRYGIGDLVPPTNIVGRGMGGISAGYNNILSINFNNPASYSSFQTYRELKSKKIVSGRALLDIGINFENRTLQDPSTSERFGASNALFSYVQVGVPLKTNWGLSFGLRPISRISYKINSLEKLKDPITQLPIDSAITQFEGEGGTYLASMGTGFKIGNLALGINAGYLFGKKEYKTKRILLNDTVDYQQANYETKTSFGNLHFSIGAQYVAKLKKNISFTLGAYGNWGQQLDASRDIIRETYLFDASVGETRLDSVYDQRDIKGKILFPASYTAGFVMEKPQEGKKGGWLFGIDFTRQSWSKYRFYEQTDSVQNTWQLRAGAELRPAPSKNYFSYVAYRFGFFTGPDYIRIKQKLPQLGLSFGMGLPIANYNMQSRGQATIINLAFEYIKRGNNNNLLKENMFRVSAGFSLSDIWFVKRKYE